MPDRNFHHPRDRRRPAYRRHSSRKRLANRPRAIIACTAWSRPKACPKSPALNRSITGASPQPPNLRASVLGTVGCREQHARLAVLQSLADLFEPGDGDTGASRQTDRLQATPLEQRLHQIGEVPVHLDGAASRFAEGALLESLVQGVPVGRHPKSPSRQSALQIRHHEAFRRIWRNGLCRNGRRPFR